MVSRYITKQVINSLKSGKVVGVFGPRRSGKTVLMTYIKDHLKNKEVLMVHGENLDVAEILSSQRISELKRFIGDNQYLFIDEAQKIPKIGVNLKLIVDTMPKVAVMVTGSSSFDLRSKIGEPLVGRSEYYYLYPLALLEVVGGNYLKQKETLEDQLIFGFYPQVYTAKTLKQKRLKLESIRDGYLLKDILELDNLKDSLFVFNLLRLIAFQIGQDVSFSELATNLNVNKKTVMRYLELLEKSYVIFSRHGFSRNLRKEYTKSPRYYFWDNGIRNSLISNYNRLSLRDDVGRLWENFCVAERAKYLHYKQISVNSFFWRTYDQKEIDIIEEKSGKLYGFECKYTKDKISVPRDFIKAYPGSKFKLLNRESYLDYLS
ncbi:MAG: AAA family ATPase [Candidatus Beckwithbacteria bacterium]|nr:AAA family ATPase [Patescibacteria group bacterium]